MRTTLIALWCFLCLLASGLLGCGPIGGTSEYPADDTSGGAGSGGSAGLQGTGLMGSAGGARPANPHNRKSLVWIWQNYRGSIATVLENANSFTHASPALYQMNYNYQSGVVQDEAPGGYYAGLDGAEMAASLHSAGLKVVPLMYAGAGNNGVDTGIQNVLTNPAIAQSFIDSQVQEAIDKGYDGWNLDWEVGDGTTAQFGPALITFLTAFKAALNAHQMELSFDLGGWYVKQCTASGGNGLVDLKALGPAVDQAIIEDYSKSFTAPTQNCPAVVPDLQDCDSFNNGLSVMCSTTSNSVSIGLITPDTNPFASQALDAVSSYGFQSVALWPDSSAFLNSTGIPNGGTWYSVLATWLAN
jgi:hypothetical protein